jgi:hypothetical protein
VHRDSSSSSSSLLVVVVLSCRLRIFPTLATSKGDTTRAVTTDAAESYHFHAAARAAARVTLPHLFVCACVKLERVKK